MIRAGLLCAISALPASAQVQFRDQSESLPPHQYIGGWEHFVGGGVAVFDCDDNGLPDVFIAGGEAPAVLWRNAGAFQFDPVDMTTLTGVTGAYPLDITNDGLMDLYVMRVGPDVVLAGTGDCVFEDVTEALEIPQTDQWTTAFSAWWEDHPRPVLAVGHYVDRSDPDGPFEACDTNTIIRPHTQRRPHMTLENGLQRFIITYHYGWMELAPGYCALSMLADYDARGALTLRISNDRHYYINEGHEQMWDTGSGRFLGPDDGWQNVSLWGMGIASVDLTGDGRDEVMLTSMGDQLLQMAEPDGTYSQAPYAIGTYAQRPHIGDDGRPSTGWHSEFGDINNDGRPDLFIAKGNVDQMPGMAMEDPNNLLMQTPDGTFAEVAATAGIATTDRSRGAALADFDLDGRLDLIVVNRRAPVELYRNETPATGNWLRISLRQDDGNSFAIGARVFVTTEDRTQYRSLRVGGGHAGGQAQPLHIGLGRAREADVTVLWPDGSESTHRADANTLLTITRP
ncbi:Repeat domain-containing protein [Cognatiyoonia koreensis]|uniref:Repeat domain-containing protein n=1 Tax=Cognatiyoonia koreensis TaxID=364200 RepID=A0A1I0PVQ5_9RHOB|nr:CRTAC1 family protein [Cognatiyoonia koreensis]SEW18433.1 Repeat domain-containing protein [Cognatiyoonia koreensis]